MKDLFNPSSVVVIGVSTQPHNLGKEIARNLFEFGYNGVIHLVGIEGGIIFGRRIYPSLDDIDEPIDLAIILTPAKTIPGLMEECGRKGIRRVIIESGGFGEFDEQGQERGRRIAEIADRYDMRFIGPNCIGLINSANGLATPFTTMKNVFRRGGVGIIAQSGGVALSLLNLLDGERLGFSKFAAIGNKLDIEENDILEYYTNDPNTNVICLYLESIRDGKRLTGIARASSKPIIVHKANVGDMSRSIAQSHTEALANDDRVVDAAFRQAGIVRFRDMQSYMDFVKILQLPRMKGRNLAIVSRSGGHAVIATDAAARYGFNLPPFREDLIEQVRSHLRADVIRLANPMDLGDLFDFNVYVRIIEDTLKEDNIDGILFLHTYFAAIEGESSRKLLVSAAELSQTYNKPVALCVATEHYEVSHLLKVLDAPVFLSPERAIGALDKSIDYHERRAFMASDGAAGSPDPHPKKAGVQDIVKSCRADGRNPLLHEALEIVDKLGIPTPRSIAVTNEDELESSLADMNPPYAVKIVADEVSHKTDADGVVLGVDHADSVRDVFRSMMDKGAHSVLVQEMAPKRPPAFELIVGGFHDPHFGPMVLLGHGGVLVEVFGKVALRMVPLSPAEAATMIDELPSAEIFRGFRGRPAIDRDALVDTILRVAYLMTEVPHIGQIDVNPVLASAAGVLAVDARIFLAEG